MGGGKHTRRIRWAAESWGRWMMPGNWGRRMMTENLVVDFPGWGGTRGRVLASYQATGEAAVTGFPLFYATALLAAARTIATAVRHFNIS